MLKKPKIAIIGGGNVGSSCAMWAASKELGDIVVVDIPQAEGMVKGRMLGGSGGSIPLVDAQNKEGNTALHCAAQHNHDVICIALVMAGKGGFPPR